MTRPLTELLLAVGGPKHGEDLADEGTIAEVMVVVDSPDGKVAIATKYIKRGVDGQIRGRRLRREVYVHESIGNQQEMAALLANVLIGQWIEEGGREIVEGESQDVVSGRESNGSPQVDKESSRSASGLYIPR